ncbi:MAG: radical SAM protein [Bacteroidales bacterium]|nr:radical SAM protein [Bacteroidales bacterium]
MINKIQITNYCGFSCSNCFSCESELENQLHVSIEDFVYMLDFVKGNRFLILGGGDPMLHPQFDKILEIVNRNEDLHFIMETHLLYNKKQIDFLIEKFNRGSYTVMLNTTTQYSNKKDILLENISLLKAKGKVIKGKVIIEQDTDMDSLFEIISESKLKRISWELGLNVDCKEWTDKQIEEYYTKIKDKAISLINFGLEKDIVTQNECGNIPLCFLNAEDIRTMAYSSNMQQGNIYNFVCEPSIVFTPDMQAFRCKNIGEYVDIRDLKNFNQLYRFFVNELDNKLYKNNMLSACGKCLIKDKNRKCGCLIFKEA